MERALLCSGSGSQGEDDVLREMGPLEYYHRIQARLTHGAAGVTDEFGLSTGVLVRPTRVLEAHADALRRPASPALRQGPLGAGGSPASGACAGMP
jgi:hypothetical protein